MQADFFAGQIKEIGIDTLVGVPDSTLKQFCDYINDEGRGQLRHYVPANEGAAVGIAMGTYLASGRPACVYMQNSGLGNTVNPLTSLAHEDVYGIPMLLLIGWRGEPGEKDEPQHKFMGRVTEPMLDCLEIACRVVDADTTEEACRAIFEEAKTELHKCRSFAIIIKKGAFSANNRGQEKVRRANKNALVREEAIAVILRSLEKEDVVVSTTGKISRELYEQADGICGGHAQAFLTVGGMGHASMIAFGIAKERPDKTVYCIDGDGAVLMHMGALAFLGTQKPDNMIHICLNNDAHESVGGMPTGAVGADYAGIARACGYERAVTVTQADMLEMTLKELKADRGLCFVEVKVSLDSREDLGRPKESAEENKLHFMKYHGV